MVLESSAIKTLEKISKGLTLEKPQNTRAKRVTPLCLLRTQ